MLFAVLIAARYDAAMKRREKLRCWGGKLNENRVLFGLILLCIGFGILNPTFLSLGNLSNILLQSTPVALVSVGMTFVILAGSIDLSVGSVLALSGVVFGLAIQHGTPLSLAIGAALLVGSVCGATSGLLVAEARVPSFVVTLGMMSSARGLSLWLTNGRSVSDFPLSLLEFTGATILGIPLPSILMVGSFILGHIFLRFTVWGRHLSAVGSSAQTAWLCGVPVPKYTVFVFAMSGLFAALASVVVTGRLNSAHPLAGGLYELDAIAAVVIGGGSFTGGRATMFGTLAGALVLSVLKNGLSILNIGSYAQQITVGLIVVATVALDTYKTRQNSISAT